MRCLPLSSLPLGLAVAALACGGSSTSPSGSSSTTSTGGSTTSSTSTTTGTGGSGGDPTELYSPPPDSCAYECDTLATCVEQTTKYACPSLGDWKATPHAPACPAWDGKYPDPVAGKCTGTAPTGDALKRPGVDPDDATGFVLPSGRVLHPAGKPWIFSDATGGLTSKVVDAPGTPFALTIDTGFGDHVVRAIDVAKLAAGADPVVSKVTFVAPETLNSGAALAGSRLFVASHDGVIHAVDLDPATGALTRNDAASLTLPVGGAGAAYASGIAASPDGSKLAVTSVDDASLLVFSIAAGATYGTLLATVPLGAQQTYGAWFDPHDAAGSTVYVSLWADKAVVAVDLTAAGGPAIKATYATDKNPEGIAFLDGRFLAVADANGDSLSIVDRASATVTSVPIEAEPSPLHGEAPSEPAYDAAAKRLYVPLGGDNSVAAFGVDLASTPPTITRIGRLATGWWPSGAIVRADGSLVVTTLRGHGGGPIPQPFSFGDSDIGDRMRGSVAAIPAPSVADLSAGQSRLAIDNDPGTRAGAPKVDCPAGVSDFPLPPTNQGASPVIDHVFFILRENKNFDSIFGDFQEVDGEPSYTLKSTTQDMDAIWHNLRAAAKDFTLSDNYYTDAVFSTQGHVLATYGRSSDYNERTWALAGPRSNSPLSVPGGGVTIVGQPVEGSLFDWLLANKVKLDILGEMDGPPSVPAGMASPLDVHYPGVGQNIGLNDLPKACYAAGRVRIGCDLGTFIYQTLPNDHTLGVSSGRATPEVMCAVNDEATGMMLDAISHSPFWKSSIVFITEDDPSSGGEHVDSHRTPFVVVSPWIKRGYVSKTHIDIASVHKMYAHLLGIPYPNRQVAAAMLPFDMFTSTPNYAPFTYTPRTWPLACGSPVAQATAGAEEELTAMWDFSKEDSQPGLGAQVWRAMRGQPLKELTPAMRARVRRYQALRKDADD